jgi:drug/metabolite transporter (DMT)-like permease
MVFGLILVAVGIIALLEKLEVFNGSVWNYTWPVILVIIGLSIVLGRFRRRPWRWFGCCPPWDDRDRPKKE